MNAIKIRFKEVGKKYYFSPLKFDLHDGMKVVVETVRGIELGFVSGEIFELSESELISELKPILRIANKNDIEAYNKNKEDEKKALEKCKKLVRNNNLDMKVLESEYTLDRQKLIIYFEADGRIDFRQLVKALAEEFRVRIELRQIGSRDGAKIIGGLGPCGLIMCCNTYIGEFDNVSIKMAKNQNLSLNPQKISGTCGKLLCCIKYENDVYTDLKKNLPDVGDLIEDQDGNKCKIMSVDVISKKAKVKYNNENIAFLDVSQAKIIKRKKSQSDDKDIE